jgi:hypothetical protein
MRTRETQAGHVGVPRRVDDPSALGGRRRSSYLAPALSEIVPAGGISARPRIKQPMVGLNVWP